MSGTNAGETYIGAPLSPPVASTAPSATDTFLDSLGTQQELVAAPTFEGVFTAGDAAASEGTDWSTGVSAGAAVNGNDQIIVSAIDGGIEKALDEAGLLIDGATTIKILKQKLENYITMMADRVLVATDPTVKAELTADVAKAQGLLDHLNNLPAKDWDNKTLGLIKNSLNDASAAITAANNTAAQVNTAYQAILANGRANAPGWSAAAIKLYTDNKDNSNLTDAQKAALKELHDSAVEFNNAFASMEATNANTTQENAQLDALQTALQASSAAGVSAVNQYLEAQNMAAARASGRALSDVNSGVGSVDAITDVNSDIAVSREAGTLMGIQQKVAQARADFETAFLAASVEIQNNALANIGITLSEDMAENKATVSNWLLDLENTIKEANLEASAETTAVLAELQRLKTDMENKQFDRSIILRVVLIGLGVAAMVAGTVMTIASAGALSPVGALLVAGGGATVGAGANA